MTTTSDIIVLARAAGAAGRSYHDWQCDDAVQAYCDDNPVKSAEVRAWEAAFEAGALEHRKASGWVTRWTTAPDDYDSFGTIGETIGEWHGKPLRRVLIHPHHVGYHEMRYGSGLHGTWSEDPREEQARWERARAERARADADRAARREASLAWLATASELEIEDAKDRDDVEPRGLKYTDLRDELKRRVDTRADAERAATWVRCRASFEDGTILVDDGTPGQRGVYGSIPGESTQIYYGVHVKEHWAHPGDAEQATVVGGERGIAVAGSLACVAGWLASGRCRVVGADDVPPEPIVRRIGHECWKDIRRVEVAGRVVWVGRARGSYEPLVLDASGKLTRAKSVRDGALAAFHSR